MAILGIIQTEIQSAGFEEFVVNSCSKISGGDTSQTFIISGTHDQFFVKINSFDNLELFRQEMIGLKTLSQCDSFVVPSPVVLGSYRDNSFLVLEYLALSNSENMRDFACSLAKLHSYRSSNFGFMSNNYIGSNHQSNDWDSDWGRFFTQRRLRPQFKMLEDSGVYLGMEKNRLLEVLPNFLNQHKPEPSLVHGDLWQGNYAFNQFGKPTIFDPACYYGDREVDLAMLELFGYPGMEFKQTYSRLQPLKKGIGLRKEIYNLYHLLNHANLFGGHYFDQVVISISSILKSIDY